ERSRTKSAAVLARSSWSSVSTSCMAGTSVRQAEHALGDDVELDLAGPALDRVAARAQPLAGEVQLALVEAGALPAERLRAGDRDRDLHAALVQLGAVDLEHRALGAGRVAGAGGVAGALGREHEGARIHLDLRDAVAQ